MINFENLICLGISGAKKVNLNSRFWHSVLECTGQCSLKN